MEKLIKENERLDIIPGTDLKIIQNRDKFCYGSDAVLISRFLKIKKNCTIIDLGTGTGIIPLLIYSRNIVKKIYGIEIQKYMANMAKRSVLFNKLEDQIEIVNIDLKLLPSIFPMKSFDVVVSNPPYMSYGKGLINPKDSLALSRHEIACTLEDIIKISNYLLKDKGKLYLVHRPTRLVDIFWLLRKYKLEPKRIRFVHPSINKKPNLLLLESVKGGNPELRFENPLYMYNKDGSFTDEIYKIYGMKKEN